MPDTTDKPESSDLEKVSPFLMALWASGHLSPQEAERRALGAARLKAAFSSIPWHARKAQNNPEYCNDLYASQVNW